MLLFPEPLAPFIVQSAGSVNMLTDRKPVSFAVGDKVTASTESVVSIVCQSTGIPRPSVVWTKDGQEVSSEGRFVIDNNGTLTIQGLQLEDSGQYVCNVENRAGRDSRASSIMVLGEEF